MPSLGADMDEGTLVEWLVVPGDTVHRGDIVAVVDTAKSAIEIEVFEDGVVEALLVEPGSTVPVGEPLARIAGGETGHVVAAPTPDAVKDQPPQPEQPPEPPVASPIVRHLAHQRGVDLTELHGSGPDGVVTRTDVEAATSPTSRNVEVHRSYRSDELTRSPGEEEGRVRASPFARRRASELDVDLAQVMGTGADGAITVADVERDASATAAASPAASPAPPAPTHDNVEAQRSHRSGELTRSGRESAKEKARAKQAAMRAVIGELMARSKREIPHYYLTQQIDLRSAMEWMREANAGRGIESRLVPAVLLLKATALAVRKVPEVNGFFVDGTFRPSEHVHLGVAVSLRGGGLVAPAIHDADQRSLDELMASLKDLVSRARAGRLKGSEMSDPTITVTNLGDQGVESVVGVIYPPQVGLVGFGRIVERPWAVDGMLAVHPVVTASLAADHRVTDGHRGGLFLAAVDDYLQRPEEL
jgi:pyruvate dehydrogenase E2 component (dihydrolipoamide acetyltransferase)